MEESSMVTEIIGMSKSYIPDEESAAEEISQDSAIKTQSFSTSQTKFITMGTIREKKPKAFSSYSISEEPEAISQKDESK